MQEKLRIYGKCLQNWMVWDDRGKKHITQVELAYTDYDPADGSVIQTGSEDFSLERYKQELTSKYCYGMEKTGRKKDTDILLLTGIFFFGKQICYYYIGI